ncbi:MAG: serine/threonine-protein kinase [Armatimonadota bacterium]|nr:serine/threonine-protein kinase [Armatimonadota bacterium]
MLADRFRIQDFLGAGAFGEVYTADCSQHGRVAVKVLPLRPGGEDSEALLREARTMAGIEHPNIVKVFEIGKHVDASGSYGYLVMEYVPGGTLRQCLDSQIRLPIQESCRIAYDVLQALSLVHSLDPPLLHGDLKPDNILLGIDDPPSVKVSDFGLSKAVCSVTGMTVASGTLHYMPPESLWGYSLPASDVFCVGMIIYNLLTGVSPFSLPKLDSDASERDYRLAIEKSRRDSPPPPSQFNPEISPALDAVTLKALALDHERRYANAHDFLEALSEAKCDKDAEARPDAIPDEPTSPIPVFGREDYRSLASSGDLSKDDVNVLWELYCDLETPISLESRGLFSPITITGFTRTELGRLHGISVSDWLLGGDTSIAELRILKDVGKMLFSNPLSIRAARAGRLVYATAIARALAKFGERISSLSLEQFRSLCDYLLSRPYLPPRYRTAIVDVQRLL